MERIEAEEKAVREDKETRIAEEKLAEEQRLVEERRVEENRVAAERKKKQEEIAEARRQKELAEDATAEAEEEQARNLAFAKLVDENRKEKEKAAKDLRRKIFKSKAIIFEDSSDEVVEQPREVIPRGTKRKRTIKMIVKGSDNLDPDVDKGDNTTSLPPDVSQPRSTCSRCVMIGQSSNCRPQSTQRPTQACEARRSRGKQVKLDEEEVYEGPAARAGERRRLEGTQVAEQLAQITEQNQDLVKLLRQSLVVQEQMLGIMVRAKKRVMEAMEESEKGEDEDEDGEGEEDEEEVENEEERRAKICEGKKCAE
ncbi:hypothetical protein F5890DRAFT_1558629 [Lentinula detonsa]|uniref:Uncharacterized protein n=1 Tax=Lentinula detonsa TaxID=2804962 RepID=A0AA38PPV6_9AGAR|nr:hypothetical protein F5890DRAFT_1558629 [Lentinula detonsa]